MKARLLLLFLLLAPVSAEQLFVRNKPFKGASMGVGASRMVELEPFAKALGFTVKAHNGGFLVTTDPNSDQGSEICEAGSAIVDGNKIATMTGTGGHTLVSLSDFCNAVGAKLVVNSQMGSSDVYLESKAKARGPSLIDKWGNTAPEERGEGSKGLAEGPGKVAVQFFEAFTLLPPSRDVKEMRGLCQRQADVDRFKKTYRSLTTSDFYQRSYPIIEKAVDRGMSASTVLSNVPLEELEAYLASKPALAKDFTESMSAWEMIRQTSATLLDQKVLGNESLIKVEQVQTDPVTFKTTKKMVLMYVVKQGKAWRIDAIEMAD